MNTQVLKVSPDRKITTFYQDNTFFPSVVAIHKDGRIFVNGTLAKGKGGVLLLMQLDSSDRNTVFGAEKGILPNDMVFDKQGGLYLTDARVDSGNPTGGVYYLSPDQKQLTPLLTHLSGGNGIALSLDGKTLYVIEFSAGVLHRLVLQDATHIQPFGETVAYRFNSPAPDSMKVDVISMLHYMVQVE